MARACVQQLLDGGRRRARGAASTVDACISLTRRPPSSQQQTTACLPCEGSGPDVTTTTTPRALETVTRVVRNVSLPYISAQETERLLHNATTTLAEEAASSDGSQTTASMSRLHEFQIIKAVVLAAVTVVILISICKMVFQLFVRYTVKHDKYNYAYLCKS
ncbi:hypothetical protein C0J52_24869 [Blattella germanica]|nr:hypothetical protein C0J52_24869 [Blattella germanica]